MGKKSREKKERQKSSKITVVSEPMNRLEKICVNLIIGGACLAFLTPLIINFKFFFPFVSSKTLYFWAVVEILLAIYVVLAIYSPRYRPRLNPLLITLVLFISILTLSSLLGADPSKSFWSYFERMEGLLAWFHCLAFFVVLSSVLKRKKDWMIVLGFSVGVAALISVISFVLKDTSFQVAQISRSGATLGNSSFLGTYLLMNFFVALWLFIRSKEGWKYTWGVALAIIGVALCISTARAAILSCAGGLFLILLLYCILAYNARKKKLLKFIGLGILSLSIIVFVVAGYSAFQQDSLMHQKVVEKFTKARFVVWEIGWEGWQERPWLGWGLENFDVVFAKHFNSCLPLRECGGETWFDRGHNIVIDTLVTSGILGFLTYLGIFGVSLYFLARRYFQKNKFWTSAVLTALLVAYFVQNLTVFDMVSSYMMFFAVLALISFYINEDKPVLQDKPSVSQWNKTLSVIIVMLMSLPFIVFVINPVRSSRSVVPCLVNERMTPEQRIAYCQKALAVSPLGKHQIRDYFGGVVVKMAGARQFNGVAGDNFKESFEIITAELKESINDNAFDLRSKLKLGQLYNAYPLSDKEEHLFLAAEVLEDAIDLSPTNQKGYQVLIHTKILQKQYPEAVNLAKKLVSLEPRLPRPYLILAETARFAGDYDLAREAIESVEAMGFSYWEDLTALRLYSNVWGHFNEHDKVIAAYEKALSSKAAGNNASKVQLHNDLGSIYLNLNKEEEAEKHFDEANNLNSVINK